MSKRKINRIVVNNIFDREPADDECSYHRIPQLDAYINGYCLVCDRIYCQSKIRTHKQLFLYHYGKPNEIGDAVIEVLNSIGITRENIHRLKWQVDCSPDLLPFRIRTDPYVEGDIVIYDGAAYQFDDHVWTKLK